MPSPTHETLFLSALINNNDTTPARDYGVLSEHFIGFQAHFDWIIRHDEQYKRCPNRAEFLERFPAFPYSEEQLDARYPATEIKLQHSKRDMMFHISKAEEMLAKNDVEAAYDEIAQARLLVTAAKPESLLTDPTYLDDYDVADALRIPMPWTTVHAKTGGMGAGELWYFAARQAQGKSSFLLDVAVSGALAGFDTVIYSLEMPKRQVQTRAHAICGHRLGVEVDQFAMLHGQWDKLKYKQLLDMINECVPGKIHIHDNAMGRVTPGMIASRANDYHLNIVDYVGLMSTDDGRLAISDYRAMAEISNQLKEVTLAKNTRILGAAQINRDGDSTRNWRPPLLKYLAQSDHLGNDGDVVMTMKRFGRDATVVSMEKNRHGQSGGLFWTKYFPNAGDFGEIDRTAAEDLKMEAAYDDE